MKSLITVSIMCLLLAHHVSAAPSARAVRLAHSPQLDGHVSTDMAWSDLAPIKSFTQQRPKEDAPASQGTEVYVGFTDTHLYIGVVCHEENPNDIIVTGKERDASLNNSDSFRMVIDSFGNGQTGFVFGTNPSGLEYDGQASNESRSSFSQDGGFDLNWDTSWQVEATIGDFGWSAEMAIPFSSLRYPSDEVQTWGFNFQRTMQKRKEVVYWAPIPRQYQLSRMSLAGSISGIVLPHQRSFTMTPYILSKSTRPAGDDDQEFGLDIKYSITPSLTLDATLNTDFAQVEVDQQQVNLDRFSLFFPEKRPFFQENSSQFEVGTSRTQLFFSRRIGIGPDGEAIPIAGGLRVSGKVNGSTNIGLLAMQTEEVTGVAPKNDFAVARINQELKGRSAIGMLLVNRSGGETDNQTYAIDGRWGIDENTTLSGFVARTKTPGISKDDHAYHIFASYITQDWTFRGNITEVGEGFNPEVGFLSRKGFRQFEIFGLHSIRPASKKSRVLEYRPHASYRGYWDFDGFHETGRLHLDHVIEWKSGGSTGLVLNHIHEGVRSPFEISDGVIVPAGDYNDWELHTSASNDKGAPLTYGASVTTGGFFGGDRLALSPNVGFRINDAFSANLSWNYNDVELPTGNFNVGLTNLSLSYSFTPKMSVAALIQYDDRDNVLATNLRFSWIQDANAGLFVVYNETDEDSPGSSRRELIIKYSRILSVPWGS